LVDAPTKGKKKFDIFFNFNYLLMSKISHERWGNKAYECGNGKIHYSRPERVGIFNPDQLNYTEGDCFDASLHEFGNLMMKFGEENFRWCHGILRNNEKNNLIKGQGKYIWHCWILNVKLNKVIDTQRGSKAMWDKDHFYRMVEDYKSYDIGEVGALVISDKFKDYIRLEMREFRKIYP